MFSNIDFTKHREVKNIANFNFFPEDDKGCAPGSFKSCPQCKVGGCYTCDNGVCSPNPTVQATCPEKNQSLCGPGGTDICNQNNWECPVNGGFTSNSCIPSVCSGPTPTPPIVPICYEDTPPKQWKNDMSGWFLQEITSGNYLGVVQYTSGTGVSLFDKNVKGNTIEWYGIPGKESHGHGGSILAGLNIGLANKDVWENPNLYSAKGSYLSGSTGFTSNSLTTGQWGDWEGWNIVGIESSGSGGTIFKCPKTKFLNTSYANLVSKDLKIYDRWIFKIQHNENVGWCIGLNTISNAIGLTQNPPDQYSFQLQYEIYPKPDI